MSDLQSIYLKRPKVTRTRTLTRALALAPTLISALTLTPTKAHENMPPRTKTVNQEQLRQLRAELRKTKKLVHSERH